MANEGSTSLNRAIDILIALGSPAGTTQRGCGVGEVARMVDREKSQVSRTLKTLAEAGLVDRDPETLGYRLGWRLFTLAESAGNQRLTAVAPAVLRTLVARLGERAHLTVLQGDHVMTVLSEQPSARIQVADWVGRCSPVNSTSSGRALLMQHSDHEVRELLADVQFVASGPGAPRDVDDLLARLHQARLRGYVLTDEEFEPGLVAAAAPVLDARRRIVAAVNISAPKFRLGKGLNAAGRQVKAAADHLSRLLAAPAGTSAPFDPQHGRDHRAG
ncbi:IclR family transcriptional regulator [Pseudonocardia nigra]|uniref:IclR family transcriptional regulator n=1 Tax=Pseudonocardia nigra TaxID=1921578 RepID=UPI001C5CD2D2|nr:IclR family transcriptional regulator [Pseudonocardia nigra]